MNDQIYGHKDKILSLWWLMIREAEKHPSQIVR